jgi:hypothetical protein
MGLPVIKDIRSFAPDDLPLYFFDSNVWIAILNQTGGGKTVSTEQPYIDFWEALVNVHQRRGNPQLEKRTKNFPKVAMPAIVLTETINAHLRIVANNYLSKNPPKTTNGIRPNFKQHYRPTDDYKKKLRQILSDFQSFSDYIEFKDDRFTELGIINNFFNFNPDLDFNDYFFAQLFKDSGIPIVTHDKDYAMFEGITILTANPKLLRI